MKTTPNQLFIFDPKELPSIPMEFSEQARKWWGLQKNRCINGHTVGGKWMSPNLYFYVNFWKILLNDGKSKTKSLATPLLRDVEWLVFTAWSLARGLSGFTNVGEIPKDLSTEDKMEWLWNLPNDNPGYPLYDNDSKDLMLLGPREFGKSYMASGGIIAHEFLFNGAKVYDPDNPRPAKKDITYITVGAGDTKYSSKLLSKFELGYDTLSQQGIEFNGKFYPHPFVQKYSGSLASGKKITAKYKRKAGGGWLVVGSNSVIEHVAYKNQEFAAQGGRNPVMIKEEIGMFENLDRAREADKETMMNGTYKFGSCFYLGTGGDMEKGTLAAYRMYYDPETYDLLPFNDRWEGKGKIGMFIPATMRAMEFKDEEGNSKEEEATRWYLEERMRIKKGKNSRNALDSHIQYNPLVPSEIFLRKIGNIFDTPSLMEHLAYVETRPIYKDALYIGELILTESGQVEWRKNDNLRPIDNFPINKEDDLDSCVVIFEMPAENYTFGRYIASNDPYNHADAGLGSSLGSTFVYDRLTKRIVAEYTGKPSDHKKYYETTRRLLMLYDAKCMYENQIKGFFDYMDSIHETFRLADQPNRVIKDIIKHSTVNREKGCHANKDIKHFGEEWINTWLLEFSDDDPEVPDKRNLHNIRSVGLLKELIMYNPDDNFDRVDSLIMLMIYIQELKHIVVEETINTDNTAFHNSGFFSDGSLYKNNFSYSGLRNSRWLGNR